MEDQIMTIIRWTSPKRFSDIFEDTFSRAMHDIDKKECDCIPAANIRETDKAFEIEIAAPGYRKEDIHISLENNILSIYCDKDQTEGEKINYTRQEFGYGTFRRNFSLPKIIDTEKITADYKAGILKVMLPKRDEAKTKLSKEIKIQ